ncbi:MAG: DUF3306 domain-containing protein [Kiloniellaceae bacterium]
MADSGDGFVSRWSKRKRKSRGQAAARPPEGVTAPEGPAPPSRSQPVEPLPDVDSLDEASDFTVFLKEGVPEAIRRKALRRLWRLNPVLANLDGLNDYDEDFTDAATVIEGLKTLYKVGRGIAGDETPEAEEPSPSAAPPGSADSVADRPDADGTPAPPAPPPPELPSEPAAPPAGQSARAGQPAAAPGRPSARDRRWGRFSG